jgi:hypothetical protein
MRVPAAVDRTVMAAALEPVLARRPGWRRIYLDLPGHGDHRLAPATRTAWPHVCMNGQTVCSAAPRRCWRAGPPAATWPTALRPVVNPRGGLLLVCAPGCGSGQAGRALLLYHGGGLPADSVPDCGLWTPRSGTAPRGGKPEWRRRWPLRRGQGLPGAAARDGFGGGRTGWLPGPACLLVSREDRISGYAGPFRARWAFLRPVPSQHALAATGSWPAAGCWPGNRGADLGQGVAP